MNVTTFRYRIRSRNSTWSIYIELTAGVEPLIGSHVGQLPVFSNLWLSLEAPYPRLLPEEVPYLIHGLELVRKNVEHQIDLSLPTVIRITKIDFPECDYQKEGLACAIAGWAGAHFGFPVPTVPFVFDKSLNRYVFYFDEVE